MSTHVTSDDLRFIADTRPDAPSPYFGVYPWNGKWSPRAFKKCIGKVQPSPREAALIVVAWWKTRYGERWREAWYYRQTAGWQAVRCRGGVWAVAEVCGVAAVSLGVGLDGRACDAASSPGCKPFPDTSAAAAGVRQWAEANWGQEGRFIVRRTWAEEVNRARRTPVPSLAS